MFQITYSNHSRKIKIARVVYPDSGPVAGMLHMGHTPDETVEYAKQEIDEKLDGQK